MNWASFHLPENHYRFDSTIKSLQKTHLNLQCVQENVLILFSTTSLPSSSKHYFGSRSLDFQVPLQTSLKSQHQLATLLHQSPPKRVLLDYKCLLFFFPSFFFFWGGGNESISLCTRKKIASVDYDKLKLSRAGELHEWVIRFGRVQSYVNLFATFFNKCLESQTGSSGGVESARAEVFTGADECC